MLALQQDDSNELDSVLDSIGIPREAASGRSVLERVNEAYSRPAWMIFDVGVSQ